MKLTISCNRLFAALLLCACVFGVTAQTLDAPAAPSVGDKWTYRFHNKGDKREPFLYTNEVKSMDEKSVWIYGESQQPNASVPQYVWRVDLATAAFLERFDFDAAAANGAGKRRVNRPASSSSLQFPLTVGRTYNVKSPWDSGKGFDEYTAEVQAFEKVKVEAGEFDAYRIKFAGFWNNRVGGNYSGRLEQVGWYAPAVRNTVKWNYSSRTASGSSWNDTTTELVKWEPGPGN